MATITAGGIGSGLDVNGILEQIVAAETEPTENRLNLKEATLQAELSAYGSLKSSISTFQSSLSKLKSPTFFNSSDASVSDTDVLSVTTSSITQAGNYSIDVETLAQSQALASVEFSSITDVIGNGTLTFDFGTTVYTQATETYTSFTTNTKRPTQSVVIDNTNNTVTGVRDAINQANIGVSASIVDNGTGFQLLLSSDIQGVNNSLEIAVEEGGTVAENIDATGLSLLAFNSSVTDFQQAQTQAAADAKLSINGLTVFRESNSITGVITGTTLDLKKADPGKPVQLVILDNNIEEAEKNIGSFVSAYNELTTVFNDLTKFGGQTAQNGPLLGDSTTRNILQQIRKDLGSIVDNGGTYNSLSSIGITLNSDGSLALDAGDLNDALKVDFDSVAQVFYASGNPSDSAVKFISSTSSTQDGAFNLSLSTVATQGQVVGDVVPLLSFPITIDASNNTLSLIVDGISSSPFSLTQASYADLDALAKEIQIQANSDTAFVQAGVSVSVIDDSGALNINSSSYGENSTISILSQNSTLGLTASAIETTGVNVAGSIDGSPASGLGRFLTGSGNASGLVLEVTGTSAVNRGSVVFSQGLASKLDGLLTQFLASEGQITSKTDSINSQITDISSQRIELTERVNGIEARLRKQFTALDVLLGKLNNTSNFLEQQLASLPTIGGNNN